MKINSDGTFHLDQGEQIPFICPQCKFPVAYDPKLFMVTCTKCFYLGHREEFIGDVYMKDNK